VFALVAVQRLTWDDGPDPETSMTVRVVSGPVREAPSQLMSNFSSEFGGKKGSIAKNDKNLRRKSGQFQLALWTTVIAGITTAFLVTVAK
jgi:hypothetical protein